MKLAYLAAGLFLASFQVLAAECPVPFGTENYLDKVADAITATKGCEQGVAVAEACELTDSGDQVIAGAARGKCENDFLSKLSSADQQTYIGLMTKCHDKYQDMQGTMYISFEAFCRLNVARLYSELYTLAE